MENNFKIEGSPITEIFDYVSPRQVIYPRVAGFPQLGFRKISGSGQGNYFRHQNNSGYQVSGTDFINTYIPKYVLLAGNDGTDGTGDSDSSLVSSVGSNGTTGTTRNTSIAIPGAATKIRFYLISGGGGGGGGQGAIAYKKNGGVGGTGSGAMGEITIDHANMNQVRMYVGGGGGGGSGTDNRAAWGGHGGHGGDSYIQTYSNSTGLWTNKLVCNGGNGGKGAENEHGDHGTKGTVTVIGDTTTVYKLDGTDGSGENGKTLDIDWTGVGGPDFSAGTYGDSGSRGNNTGDRHANAGKGGKRGIGRFYFIL